MSHFVETPADIEVKERLWSATCREAEKFAKIEAAAHIPGNAYSDGQKDATAAAKNKGYPIGLIRAMGRAIRSGEAYDDALYSFREKIGLSV